jgi:hypothetical protein
VERNNPGLDASTTGRIERNPLRCWLDMQNTDQITAIIEDHDEIIQEAVTDLKGLGTQAKIPLHVLLDLCQ